MFSTSTLATATLALAALTSAQYLDQTRPFKLILSSPHNDTLNGSSLFACHEGAAIEGACLAGRMTTLPTAASSFAFNYSTSITPQNADLGSEGFLTYQLIGGNFNISQPMELTMLESSNVAHPIFSPSETGTLVAFDKDEMLNIQEYVDDTVYPPRAMDGPKAYYRWYLCTTYYGGYTYETLNWVLGSFPPQNPSCQKVDVKREYL